MSTACATCRFARPFPEPGPKPVIPPAPKRHWFWGGEDAFDRFDRMHPWQVWADRHEHFVKCARYPGEQPTMRKVDICGEYQSGAAA